MKFNAIQFCEDYGINYITEGNNVSVGSIEIQCPLCDDHSFHGGFFIKGTRTGKYSCWRCGSHWIVKIISKLLQISISEALDIYNNYVSDEDVVLKKSSEHIVRKEICTLPPGCSELKEIHKNYLMSRGYNPDALVQQYDIKGTNHLGDFKFRIIIPVYLGGKLISYQGRSIIKGQNKRYKNCELTEEAYPLKHSIYNIDNVWETGVVLEGVFDSWRWGKGSVSTFGTGWTKKQAYLLASKVERAIIVYDSEEKAQKKAESLAIELASLGVDSYVGDIGGGDPDELTNKEIRQLKKDWGIMK